MMSLPGVFSLEYWAKAWATAQIGVQPIGLRPYFLNSILMVVPSVFVSTMFGAFAGFVLAKWRFKFDKLIFGLILFAALFRSRSCSSHERGYSECSAWPGRSGG